MKAIKTVLVWQADDLFQSAFQLFMITKDASVSLQER